jgi:sulfur-oxidizing protein SoxX
MLHASKLLPLAVWLGTLAACNSGRHSPAGFRLPENGSIERGKTAFVALGCSGCHEVSGVDLPQPTARPPVMVALGGERTQEMPDGYLVTSIIYPDYRLAAYPKELITVNGKSRMPDYTDKMTVRQLADVVAFLQSRYTVRRMVGKPAYY